MTDQPDSLHQDALGMLEGAGQLVARAVHMALRALPEDSAGRWTDDQALTRATQIATIAAASARVAHGLVAVEHVELLREFEERVDARAKGFEAAMRTISDEDGRPPYLPPTLEGPYDPDREHDR